MFNKLVIHLSKIRQNILNIKSRTDRKIISVVKANAYGHNAVKVANYVQDIVDMFAVANLYEAKALIMGGITKNILVLSKTIDYDTSYSNIIYMVDNIHNLPHRARVHIAINSGMNRYGVDSQKKFLALYRQLKRKHNSVEGVFSHFYSRSPTNCTRQIKKFNEIVGNINLPTHFSSSHSLDIDFPQDYVRLGICQYIASKEIHTQIVELHRLKKGDHIGYGRTRAKRDCMIAVLPIGYADGLDLRLSNKWQVTINGTACNLVGKICMDCCFAIVDNRAKVGDEVIFYDGDIDKIANATHSTEYEQMCRLYGERYEIIFD